MNIGSVIRGLMGDAKAGETKQIDMQPGQVVRGVVLKVSEDGGEAVLQIQGAQIRAKLETPLQPGQTTLLQVQPSTANGMTVLKPLSDSSNLPSATVAVADVLKSLELPDTPQNRELILAMQRSGVPLTSDNAAALRGAMLKQGGNAKMEPLMQAAAVAFQRGLPITQESIIGLRQAMFGRPLDQLLSSLEEHIESAIRQGGAPERSAAGTAADKLPTPAILGGQGNTPAAGGIPAGSAATISGQASMKQAMVSTVAAQTDFGSEENAVAGNSTMEQKGGAIGERATANLSAFVAPNTQKGAVTPNIIRAEMDRGSSLPGAAKVSTNGETELQKPTANADITPAKAFTDGSAQLNGHSTTTEGSLMRLRSLLQVLRGAVPQMVSMAATGEKQIGVAGTSTEQQASTAMKSASDTSTAQPVEKISMQKVEPWVGHVLKLLGAEHEQQALRAAVQPAHVSTGTRTEHLTHTGMRLPDASVGVGTVKTNSDTVKGALLQLIQSEDVPPALKEAAQQVVQHLTGQQLLLNTDRTSPFAQVHMFIPFVGPDGRETASVQIQSQRGKKGELDSSNCRLWFDLDMKTLGPTLVDVHVVDRIVSLKVHNDQEWAAPLLESGRESISEAMGSLGYQLISLRAEALPVRTEQTEATPASIARDYVPQAYKGVDLKI